MNRLTRRAGAARFGCALALLACVALDACHDGEASDQRAPQRVARRIQPTAWDTVFQVTSSADDSTLLLPFRPAAGRDGIYLADYYADRVLHYDSHGRLRWIFGRKGSGPDEFRQIRDLKVDSAGFVWVLDPGNLRLTVLRPDGTVETRIPLTGVDPPAEKLVPLGNREAILVVGDTRAPFLRIDHNGNVRERMALPWPGYRRVNELAGQLTTAVQPNSRLWAAAFQTGDGFFTFREGRWLGYRGWYVEHVKFPDIETRRHGNTTTTRMKTRPVTAGESVTLSRERLYVLFGGTSGQGRRLIDSYSIRDGRYLESVLLPDKVDAIAWSNGGFYVVYNHPYPRLAFLRPRRVALP